MADEDMGVAWLVSRLIVSKILGGKNPPDLGDVDSVVGEARAQGRQVWMSMVPAIVKRMVGSGSLEEDIATEYANQLGDQLDDASARALREGYTASLGKGVDRSLSWARVAEAWGLDGAQMRSYIGTFPQSGYVTEAIPKRSRKQLETLLNTRADRIKTNEGYAISQMAQQVYWIRMKQDGLIDPDVRKRWHTAMDERVCPVCGPIDKQTVSISETFSTNVFAPPVHPNCRCWVEIIDGEVITKNMPARQYDRDEDGRFAEVNTLVSSPKVEPVRQRRTARSAPPTLNKDDLARMLRVVDGKVYSYNDFPRLDPTAARVEEYFDAAIQRSPYLVKEYANVYLTPEKNPIVEDRVEQVSHIIYDSKTRAGRQPVARILPTYVTMPEVGNKRVTAKPEEFDGYWMLIDGKTYLAGEKFASDGENLKIAVQVPSTFSPSNGEVIGDETRGLSGHLNLIYRPVGHRVSDGSIVLSGDYVSVENYEFDHSLSSAVGLDGVSDISTLAPAGLTSEVPRSKSLERITPQDVQRSPERSTAATHESTGRGGFEMGLWDPIPQTVEDKKVYARQGNRDLDDLVRYLHPDDPMRDEVARWIATTGMTDKELDRTSANWGAGGITGYPGEKVYERDRIQKRWPRKVL